MMTDSYNVAPSVMRDAFRLIFSVLDDVFYGLLQIVYQLFFNVASSDIFANDTIMKFYSRVQLILGVFMMFQLAMIIIRGIVNPDGFTDSKTGIGNLIMRICVALFLLTALVPINIPSPQNEYEKQLNNNGLLFGTLYSLQHRILENNTIGRLILGTNDDSDNYVSTATSNSESLKKASRIFASTILKGFYRINLVPEDQRSDKCKKADDPAIYNECRMCQTGIDDYINEYKKVDAYPSDIIALVNETCTSDAGLVEKVYNYLKGTNRYIITYTPVISTIVAIVFVFIIISFTIDVAVRAIKLAILRLIAPIPIISYMDPKGSKDNAFNSWVKVLTSTYLDLFVRLAIVYFVLFLIQSIIINGMVVAGEGIVKVFSYIAIFIGMFIFAKQAPKFIRQVLGIKDDSFRLFGGIKDALGVGAMAAGVASGAISGGVSAFQNNGGNLGKSILSGISGAIGGGVNAGKKFYGSKEINSGDIMSANRKYANQRYSNAADESTFKGRLLAGAQANVGFKNDYQKMEDQMKYYNAANDALSRINKAFDNNGDTGKITFDSAFANRLRQTGNDRGKSYTFNNAGDLTDREGNVILKHGHEYSLKDLNDTIGQVSSYSDGDMKDAVNEAKKQAQDMRFKKIRSLGGSKEARARLVEMVNDASNTEWNENDLIAYDALHTIYDVGDKYKDEAIFKDLSGRSFEDQSISWGKYKGAAAGAGRKAEQIKNGNDYIQAKANAQRASDNQNKPS